MQTSKNTLLAYASCFWLCLLCANTGWAEEHILNYHSDITVHADASMTVLESITIKAEGNAVQRGIYRDFPTHYKDRLGNNYRVDFEVLGVNRDEQSEDWHTEDRSNGVRVYAGSADRLLAPGIYTYQIRYRTNRQLGYFADHDELYWNVNGNGWTFAINSISASITLPTHVPPADVSLEGYVGTLGARGRQFATSSQATPDKQNVQKFSIRATRALAPREGLTLVLSWPKGLVYEPTQWHKLLYLLQDNLGLLLALLGLVGSLIYLHRSWHKVGRDPKPGPIFAHYEPPDNYSPASTRYISQLGYDNETFSAAIVNLAVNGHLTISYDNKTYTLQQQASDAPLAAGEAVLLKYLFRNEAVVTLENSNHQIISAARKAHKRALQHDYANTYFLINTGHIWPSLAGLILALIIILVLDAMTPFAAGVLVLSGLIHLIYVYLLKAPTLKGRRLMDKLEGFKLYLEVAEKDDLNLQHPPQMTPKLFERYLPFAIALGVEQAWAEQFTEVFAKLAADQGVAYHPTWYRGNFSARKMANFAGNIGQEFNSAISSAATPPGSSSGGGGGGFSGGGGGGGGGGGW
jgi:uncharacterized membrane protein YgcG